MITTLDTLLTTEELGLLERHADRAVWYALGRADAIATPVDATGFARFVRKYLLETLDAPATASIPLQELWVRFHAK